MKMKIAVAALFVCIGACIPGTVKAGNSCDHSQKIYVTATQVAVDPEGSVR